MKKRIGIILSVLMATNIFVLSKDVQASTKSRKQTTIVVDPGHIIGYGVDTGSVCTIDGVKYDEGLLNMELSMKLSNKLKNKGYNVVMTRDPLNSWGTDTVIDSLKKRVQIAENNDADLFISVHHNNYTSNSANGTEVWYSNPKSSKISVTNNAVSKGQSIAVGMAPAIAKAGGYYNRGAKNNDFYVTYNTTMPAVLVEAGFISNPSDAKKAANYNIQEKVANAIANEVEKHLDIKVLEGWEKVNGRWYYLDKNGNKIVGWKNINNATYYFEKDGVMQTGWKSINGSWYYFNEDGAMQTGWRFIDKKWYFMDYGNGKMLKGWLYLDNQWYYTQTDGSAAKGWKDIDSQWYLFDEVNTKMLKGWNFKEGNWYFLNETNGKMLKGWIELNKEYYYLNTDGAAIKGWSFIGGNWYYFNNSNIMVKNVVIDGWKIDGNGIATKL